MTKQKILTFEDINNAKDITITPLEVKEWGGVVLVKSMSGSDREEYDKTMAQCSNIEDGEDGVKFGEVDWKRLRSKTLELCMVGEDGARILSEDQAILLMDTKSSAALDIVLDHISKENGLRADAGEEAKKSSTEEMNCGSGTS